jgi:ubiquinone/menaquinone biosynthesis C-methylase UbiE
MNQKTTSTESGGHTCPWWFLFTFDNPLRRLIHDPQKILSPYVSRGNTILDVGCGMGVFSLGLAELVGPEGKVITADLQEKMLAGLQKRAERAGLFDRIQLQHCTHDEIGVDEPLDFALAFWMAHEVRQPLPFLRQIYQPLRPGANLLIAEPLIHVSSKAFEQTVSLAQETGFQLAGRPQIRASRAVLLRK